jgi:phosphatidylethanolamine/phosphatidyl-N-methylethanolamine N-methyltransferase
LQELQQHVLFLRKFLVQPVLTGAVAPSSAGLAEVITAGIGLEQASTVVELGPGTGAFTGAITRRARPGARLVAVEVDPAFASGVQARFPQVCVINGNAERLAEYLGPASAPVDCVVSGLPWAAFDAARQTCILAAVVAALRPQGAFATFAYAHAAWLPPGRRFRRMLEQSFSAVQLTPVVWKNLPPAFVYRCTK